MKGNIYIKANQLQALLRRLSFIVASTLITALLPAQQQTAHNVRNVNPNLSKNNSNTLPGSVTTVKTLSVLPGVTPADNALPVQKTDNTLNQFKANPGRPGLSAGYTTSAGNVNSIGAVNSGNLLLSNSAAKLSSFTAESVNGEYRLAWEPVVENDVIQYTVEYSLNNIDFQSAGTVSSSGRTAYHFNHVTDAHTTMYYRLKMTDAAGLISYTNPFMVTNTLAKPADLVTPTIIRDGVLNITLSNTYKNVQLFNTAGIEVFREYLGGRTGNRVGFNLPSLPAGPYFVKLTGSNISCTQRVIVM